MESIKNPLENYKQQITEQVLALPQIKDHVHLTYRNLTQTMSSDEPMSIYVEQAIPNIVRIIVEYVIEHIKVAIDPSDAHFRDIIALRIDELIDELDKIPDIHTAKDLLREAFRRSLQTQNQHASEALIRHFDLSFAIFFNIVAQASLYLINKIDIKYMAMTEDEVAAFQASFRDETNRRGIKTTSHRDNEVPEAIAAEQKPKPKNIKLVPI